MKVYIAARYGRRFELRPLVDNLKALGIHSTSRWIFNEEMTALTQEEAAIMDVEDVLAADAFLFFAEPNGSVNKGGGRYFELGLAYARMKSVVVIQPPAMPEGHGIPGKHEVVFVALPTFTVVDTLEQGVAALAQIRDALYS